MEMPNARENKEAWAGMRRDLKVKLTDMSVSLTSVFIIDTLHALTFVKLNASQANMLANYLNDTANAIEVFLLEKRR